MMFNTGAKDLAAETPLPTLYFASKNFSIHVMCMHSVSRITEHGRYLHQLRSLHQPYQRNLNKMPRK
jgi:hypothetical protein